VLEPLSSPDAVIITGAAGFLGSAITVDLCRDHQVTAIDRREPSPALRQAAPGAMWERLDVAEAQDVAALFSQRGRGVVVIHLAAFYHFGTDWLPEYQRTNIQGTSNVLRAALRAGARRFIFASSVAALEPPPPSGTLTEKSPSGDFIPYAKSKTMGEAMVAELAHKLPAVVLRIGGAFSDWCELPPLYSLIRLWSGWGPAGQMIPGQGESGIPYIHRADVVRFVRRCLECQETLDRLEMFLVSQVGAVSHRELFPVIRQAAGRGGSTSPRFISPAVARLGLGVKSVLGRLTGQAPYEQPWMLDFVDRPWSTDPSYTQGRLDWRPCPGLGILERLPVMLQLYADQRRAWEARNQRRNRGDYGYAS
jgi:nucleoside-diphosphate-sugar epimerase